MAGRRAWRCDRIAPWTKTPTPLATTHGLSHKRRREREIAEVIAAGLSNREIAERLLISEGTVEVHVKHILSKLNLKSRAQVAAGWYATSVVRATSHRRASRSTPVRSSITIY